MVWNGCLDQNSLLATAAACDVVSHVDGKLFVGEQVDVMLVRRVEFGILAGEESTVAVASAAVKRLLNEMERSGDVVRGDVESLRRVLSRRRGLPRLDPAVPNTTKEVAASGDAVAQMKQELVVVGDSVPNPVARVAKISDFLVSRVHDGGDDIVGDAKLSEGTGPVAFAVKLVVSRRPHQVEGDVHKRLIDGISGKNTVRVFDTHPILPDLVDICGSIGCETAELEKLGRVPPHGDI